MSKLAKSEIEARVKALLRKEVGAYETWAGVDFVNNITQNDEKMSLETLVHYNTAAILRKVLKLFGEF